MSGGAKFPPSLTGLSVLLVMAMGMPMMIFYAIGILGPNLIVELGITHQQLGWLTASTFGLAAILSPWAGIFVDRLGTRIGLMVLFFLVGLSFSLMAVLPGFGGLITALLFCGAAQSLANPVTNQTIAQAVPVSLKPSIVGLKQSGVQASALLAGLVLPPLVQEYGLRVALATWAPMALLMMILVSRWVPSQNVSEQKKHSLPMPNAVLSMLMAIQLSAGLTLSSFMTFIGVYANQFGVSESEVGLMVGCFGLIGILSRMILTPVAANLKDEAVLLVVLFVLAGVSLAIMREANAQQHWKIWFGVIGMGVTVVASNAIAMSMLLRDNKFGRVSNSAALLSGGFFCGFAVGPPSFGWLLSSNNDFSDAWLILIVVLAVGSLIGIWLIYIRRTR